MLTIMESDKSVQDVQKQFSEVVSRHKFGVLGEHNLKQQMNKKGALLDRDCVVFEVCNPIQAKKVLEKNMSIATALPCRIAVYRDGDKTKIATLKPTTLFKLFPNPELEFVAEEVEKTLEQIIRELI